MDQTQRDLVQLNHANGAAQALQSDSFWRPTTTAWLTERSAPVLPVRAIEPMVLFCGAFVNFAMVCDAD